MSGDYRWPVVTVDDPGLRDASPGVCFYCGMPIGRAHGMTCVTICRLHRFDVLIDGEKVGTYESQDPCFWTVEQCVFHKNESSWCMDNALEAIKWSDESAERRVDEHEGCVCGLLEFRYAECVDETPRSRA